MSESAPDWGVGTNAERWLTPTSPEWLRKFVGWLVDGKALYIGNEAPEVLHAMITAYLKPQPSSDVPNYPTRGGVTKEQVEQIIRDYEAVKKHTVPVYKGTSVSHMVSWTNGWQCICTCGEMFKDESGLQSKVMDLFADHLKEVSRA